MLTILFYTYFTITATVLSAMVVSGYQKLIHNKTTPSTLASLKPEDITTWYSSREDIYQRWEGFSGGQKCIVALGVTIGLSICMVGYTFFWWVAPKTRLKLLYNCLTSSWVVIK
ncbi:hypothetical protein VPHK406_0151 [Vibrio phage K406]